MGAVTPLRPRARSPTTVRVVTPPPAPDPDWPGVRLHVVTGKGGTGKSTVSAALAMALASRG